MTRATFTLTVDHDHFAEKPDRYAYTIWHGGELAAHVGNIRTFGRARRTAMARLQVLASLSAPFTLAVVA